MTCRPDKWWLGGIPLALIWAGANMVLQGGIEADLGAESVRVLAGDPSRAWARVEPKGRDLLLTGEAPSAEAKRLILGRLGEVRGARRVEDAAVAPAGPLQAAWTATREGNRVVLTGPAPEPARAGVVAAARQIFPDLDVQDETKPDVTAAADSFTAAAALALRQLAGLESGTATVGSLGIVVHGQASSPEAYEALRAASAGSPQGLQVDISNVRPASVVPYQWSVARRGDRIELAGYAPSEAARAEVIAAARKAFPALQMADRMRIAGGFPPEADFGAAARLILDQASKLSVGTIEVSDTVVSLRGETFDKEAVAAIRAALAAGMPAGLRLGAVELKATVVSPYTLTARRGPETVRLSGYQPDAASREAVLRLIRRRFFKEQVIDDTQLADGAPPSYLGGVGFALEQLSLLASGEATVSDTSVRIVGETPYDQVAETMSARALGAVPTGWTATVDVKARGAERLLDARACQELGSRVVAQPLIRFEAGQAELPPEAKPALDELAEVARRCFPVRLEISAHATSAASPDTNLDLSQRRAAAVVAALVEAGIPTDRLEAVGYGDAAVPSPEPASAPADAASAGAGPPGAGPPGAGQRPGERIDFKVKP